MNYYVITWKPERGTYSEKEFDSLKVELRRQGFADTNWSVRTTAASKGDCVLIFRQGKETGLMGFGEVMGPATLDEKGIRRCKTRIHNLRDSNESPYLTKQNLTDAGIPVNVLNVQASGSHALTLDETRLMDALCLSVLGHHLFDLCMSYKNFWPRKYI